MIVFASFIGADQQVAVITEVVTVDVPMILSLLLIPFACNFVKDLSVKSNSSKVLL
jgi:hypothetical protein